MLKNWRRKTLAIISALAIIGLGLSVGPMAQARNVVVYPTNHVYIAVHGVPTYSFTVEFFDLGGNRIGDKHTGSSSGSPASFSWKTGSMRIHISGAWNDQWGDFTASTDAYDHCYLVTAGGNVRYTGDNVTGGCHKP